MDGVIVDSEHHHHKTEIATFKHFGINLDPELNRKYKGVPLRKHFSSLVEELKLKTSLDDLLKKQNENLEKVFSINADLFEGVKETLEKLKGKFKIALATSSQKYFVEIVLKRFKIEKYFNILVTADDITKGKPDPEIFLKTARLLEMEPSSCVVVEDSIAGMKAAKRAGMLLIAHKVDHNKDLDFSLADFVIEDLREISKIIKEINNE